MNSTVIQHWQFSYLCVAFLVATAASVVSDQLRASDPPAPVVRFTAVGLIGALWPLAIVGFIQLWTIAKLAAWLRPAPARTEAARRRMPRPARADGART